jgi:hypothetical protein
MTTATIQPTAPTATAQAVGHAHHWVIEEANGPRSAGVCKRCGEIRAFKNWIEDADFITTEERRSAA